MNIKKGSSVARVEWLDNLATVERNVSLGYVRGPCPPLGA